MDNLRPSKKIVLIDDNFVIRNVIKTFLGKLEQKQNIDLKIFSSDNGVQGIGYVFITNPDIIIVDSTLPKYSGREIVDYLLSNKKFSDQNKKVIILTESRNLSNIPPNFCALNKHDKRFLQNLLFEISKEISENNRLMLPEKLDSWITSIGQQTILWANRSDITVEKIRTGSIILKSIFLPGFIINQFVESFFLTILKLTTKNIEDDNIDQVNRDEKRYRIRYYPAMATLITFSIIIIIQICAFLTGGTIIFQTANKVEQTTAGVGDDFKVQRGVTTIPASSTTATITAGTDYTAPSSSSKAFIRITNTSYTGAGRDTGGGNMNANNVTTRINDPSNITTSITFTRSGTTNNTRIAWEIIEYIGTAGGPNEIIVRDSGTSTFTTTGTTVDTSTISGVSDPTDVVVFVTGYNNPDTGTTDYNTGLVTSEYVSASNVGRFTRGEASGDAVVVSWAIVEFTGSNWKIQRVEHNYSAAGSTQTETITPVNDLSRAFIYAQKRSGTGLQGLDEYGHEVWLSSTSQVSFLLQSGSSTPSDQYSVAWIVENTQTSGKVMVVERGTASKTATGSEPGTINSSYGPIADLSIASVFANDRSTGTGTAYPNGIFAVTLTSTSNLEFWFADLGNTQNIRWEVVEWPTAPTTNVTVNSFGTQTVSIYYPEINNYIGGGFSFSSAVTNNITGITIREQGSIDGSINIANIRLFYENDSSAPYDCASESFGGSEIQYGVTDTNGFDSSNGNSTFTGSVAISATSTMCVYVVLDVTGSPSLEQTIEIDIENPSVNVTASTGTISPASQVAISGNTTLSAASVVGVLGSQESQLIVNSSNNYIGGAFAINSLSGTRDVTAITITETGTINAQTNLTNIKLFYELDTSAPYDCTSESYAATETQFGSTDLDGFSSTDGNSTFSGSVSVAAASTMCVYVVLDIGSGASSGETIEIEITNPNSNVTVSSKAVGPSTSVQIPATTIIKAATEVTSIGSQISTLDIPSTNNSIGGVFVITSYSGSKNVTSIKVTEAGSVNAQTGLDNIKLFYELDTTNPYDCTSESYNEVESQFGSTDTNGFSSSNGSVTMTGSVGISTTSTMCLYVVLDIVSGVSGGSTLELEITIPNIDVVVSTGSIGPGTAILMSGTTTLNMPGAAFNEGMLVYADGTGDIIKYKIISDGGVWSSANNVADIDTGSTTKRAQTTKLYSSVSRDEFILLSVHSASSIQYLYGQVFDGSNWGNVQLIESFSTGILASSESRWFYDGTYLADGRFMVVSSDLSNTPQFTIWDGSSWSTVSAPTQDTGGVVNTIVTKVRPGTSEVMVVVQDDSDDINTIYYDGAGTATTDWSSPVEHGVEYDGTNEDVINFTWSSNNPLRGILVFEDSFSDTTPNINIFTANGSGGGSWGTSNESVDTGDEPTEVRIVDRPGTNEFIFCVKDAVSTSPDINCLEENDNDTTPTVKSVSGGEITTDTDPSSGPQKPFDIAYESNSGATAIVVYSNATSVPKLKKYDPETGTNGTWDASETDLSDVTEALEEVNLFADPNSDNIAILLRTNGLDVHTVFWDGQNNVVFSSGDKAMTEHSTASGQYTTAHSAYFAWKVYSPNYTPSVSNVSLNAGSNINLTENTTTTINFTATVTDANGYSDISAVVGKTYRSGVTNGQNCTNNNNNCYTDSSCTLSGCSGNSCTATCSVDIYFHAEPTSSGTTYSAEYWIAWVQVSDSINQTAEGYSPTSLTEMNSLMALNVTSTANYGTVFPGNNTGSTNQTIDITNTGNIPIDGEFSGTNLCSDYPTCSGSAIFVGNQQYSLSTFTYGAGTALTSSAVAVQLNLGKPTLSPSNSNTSSFWGIGLPSIVGAGVHSGSITISAKIDE